MTRRAEAPRAGLGPWRGFGWLAAAVWWSAKSPSGGRPLLLAALPWVAVSAFAPATGGLALMAACAFYPQLCLWSALCARACFRGGAESPAALRAGWVSSFASSRGLPLAYAVCGAAAMLWVFACVRGTGIGPLLEAMRLAPTQAAARALAAQAWERPGLDGLALPLAILELGVAAANAVWIGALWASLAEPGTGTLDLLRAGLARVARAPLAALTLSFAGAAVAQAALFVSPAALLSGVWFLACAFAARDFEPKGAGAPG